MKFIEKYTGILRTFKFLYVLYNIFQFNKLKHNLKLYARYGLKKSIFSSISHKDFERLPSELPWLDDSEKLGELSHKPIFNSFSPEIQEQLTQWSVNGFMLLKNFFSDEKVDAVNAEIDAMLEQRKVDFNYTSKKIMFAFHHSEYIQDIIYTPALIKLLNFTMGRDVIPFQTINFLKGSEQKAHSDSIHMTTHPLGYLVAVWIALEDTHINNGTLFYYPGSHKLPYLLNNGFNSGSTKYRIGDHAYKNYEDKLQEIIETNKLEKVDFYAKKGDVFIWHANLIHGGNPVLDKSLTRKSMVIHYYCRDVICYHELTQRPSFFHEYPTAEVREYDNDDND